MSGAYEGWAVVELMGHRRLAGKVSEAEQYGTVMLRLDVHDKDESVSVTQFYGGSAIYCVTPCDEATARSVASRSMPAPVSAYELAPPRHDDWDDDGA